MPRYELMYILSGSIADNETENAAKNLLDIISTFGGSEIEEEKLGKKKLAYPIKHTKNGYYGVLRFSLNSRGLAALDAKIRTLKTNVIRYLLTNIDEHQKRLAKDHKQQSALKISAVDGQEKGLPAREAADVRITAESPATNTATTEIAGEKVTAKEYDLDEQIAAALNDDQD